jgi:nucleoid-associated protein YgaU
MPAGTPRQNPTSGVLAVSRSHVMVAGDSLPSVAYAEYGDATMWRLLADYNGIDDPMRVAEGATLLLPAADQLLATGGR